MQTLMNRILVDEMPIVGLIATGIAWPLFAGFYLLAKTESARRRAAYLLGSVTVCLACAVFVFWTIPIDLAHACPPLFLGITTACATSATALVIASEKVGRDRNAGKEPTGENGDRSVLHFPEDSQTRC